MEPRLPTGLVRKYWLDPQRAKLNGEEQFHSALTQQDWISEVEQRFAAWLNALLKKRFPKHQDDFTATEYNEWRKYFRKNYIDNYAAYIRRYYELPKLYLLFDHVEIQAANTISSPITYGFPALTGFTGAIHALSRKLFPQQVELGGVMIACHDYQILGYKIVIFQI
ncbi:CRISPR-associated protein [Actinobacillus equuli]|nr:CRISPR-associated protein [Actinobacillus equuli]